MRAARFAASRGDPARSARRRTDAWRAARALASACLILVARTALAEPGFELSVATDDRFRGVSVSDKRPVATALVSYDDDSGFYAGISGTLVATRDDGVQPLRSVQYTGYSRRIGASVAVDAGVSNRLYSHYFTGEYARRFVEGYVGLVGRSVSSHLYYSPDYDGDGGDSVYVEVNASLLERGPWSLSSHTGLLRPPREDGRRHAEVDWRLGATRRLGRLAITLQWVGSGPDHETSRWRQGLVLGARRSF